MLLTPLFLIAAASPLNRACDSAASTQAIVQCLSREAQLADRRLNAAYRNARTRVPAAQARSLQTAQRAWLTFRDANCRAYAAGEGTIARIESAQCLLDTTVQRTRELEGFGRRD